MLGQKSSYYHNKLNATYVTQDSKVFKIDLEDKRTLTKQVLMSFAFISVLCVLGGHRRILSVLY